MTLSAGGGHSPQISRSRTHSAGGGHSPHIAPLLCPSLVRNFPLSLRRSGTRTQDSRHSFRPGRETQDGATNGRRKTEQSTHDSTLNGRRIAEWRTRNGQRRTERSTEDGELDGGQNARRKTESSMQGGTLNGRMNAQQKTDSLKQDSTLNGIWSAPVLFLMNERRLKQPPTGAHDPTLSSDAQEPTLTSGAYIRRSPSSLVVSWV